MKKLVFVVLVALAQNMYALDYSKDEKKEVAHALAGCYQILSGAVGQSKKEKKNQHLMAVISLHERDEKSIMKNEEWKNWGLALALETRVVFREMFGI